MKIGKTLEKALMVLGVVGTIGASKLIDSNAEKVKQIPINVDRIHELQDSLNTTYLNGFEFTTPEVIAYHTAKLEPIKKEYDSLISLEGVDGALSQDVQYTRNAVVYVMLGGASVASFFGGLLMIYHRRMREKQK